MRDNGPALSEAEFIAIFDRTRTARLAIATTAITAERIGGFVRVETAEGIGTAVHLYFPRFAKPIRPIPDLAPPAAIAE